MELTRLILGSYSLLVTVTVLWIVANNRRLQWALAVHRGLLWKICQETGGRKGVVSFWLIADAMKLLGATTTHGKKSA